ncbi:hypothetical protein Dsin_030218 [Dipteronia sinensis]|uniref:Uncharacterized protein n=1 Tax=Dipteronia sinensis TaxID=43782 RepID=A0AAD9ZJ35_9ROSI|nr:hypothetical protein Dsin_030218 [Dipteronia sinensis]
MEPYGRVSMSPKNPYLSSYLTYDLVHSLKQPKKLDKNQVEGEEGLLPGGPEPSVRYHSGRARILTLCQDLRAKGQSQVDSFRQSSFYGVWASQKATEACKGFLGLDGDWPSSVKAEGSLTARPTRRAGTKVCLSDPTVPSGRVVAQWIKVTLGITG